jgi:hypothetical protein
LVPTFKQLQRTQPEVALRWFERGKVWENPEAARAASLLKAAAAKERRPRGIPAWARRGVRNGDPAGNTRIRRPGSN